MPRKRRRPAPLPFTGDHGPGTEAATAGTVVIPVKGEEHNRTARRQRINILDHLHHRYKSLSLRQYQAGIEIRDAHGTVEKLSSGGPLKETVDASPRPDATIAMQVDAMSRLKRAMEAVPAGSMRFVVEHVCWYNQPLHTVPPQHANASANLKVALELVANHLRY